MSRKARATISLIMLLVAILVVTKWAAWQRTKDEEYIIYKVEEGDTLFKIARDKMKGDIRKNVYMLRKVNNVSPIIKRGQTLKLPRS